MDMRHALGSTPTARGDVETPLAAATMPATVSTDGVRAVAGLVSAPGPGAWRQHLGCPRRGRGTLSSRKPQNGSYEDLEGGHGAFSVVAADTPSVAGSGRNHTRVRHGAAALLSRR